MKLALAALAAMVTLAPVQARDSGQWAQTSPDMREWVRGLRDKNGVGCCDEADGEDVDGWDIRQGSYWVRVKGEWLKVPPEAQLDVPNRLGYARVWLYHENGHPKIRCFLPGAGG